MAEEAKGERRRDLRVSLNLLVRVEGYEADKSHWNELTTTHNASAGGVAFHLERPLFVGQVLRLTMKLPFPRQGAETERHGHPSYDVYGIVRDSQPENGGWRAGVMFFGEQPPRGFEDNPGARFLFPWDVRSAAAPPQPAPDPPARDPGAQDRRRDRRVSERYDVTADFWLQQVDEWEEILGEGFTVSENISRGGARLVTAIPVVRGDILLLRELGGRFETRAEVTDLVVDKDGVRRLHVRFVGGPSPDHLVPDP